MRSKRYQALVKKIDPKKVYAISEAVTAVGAPLPAPNLILRLKSICGSALTPKGEQGVRGTVALPHGTGKNSRLAVFTKQEEAAQKAGAEVVGSEELIQNIKATGKIDFDIALASPEMMKSLAPIAKILGPKGFMPSPKSETVVSDDKMSAAIEAVKKGKANFKK